MSRAPLTSPSLSSRVTDVASSPRSTSSAGDAGLTSYTPGTSRPSSRRRGSAFATSSRAHVGHAQLRQVGLGHRRAQLVAADAPPLPVELRARRVRDQRQHARHRGAVRVAGVVQLDAAADLELADTGGGVEQARDGGTARHLAAHQVVAGLHREDPRLGCRRPGERLDALDDVGTLHRAADLGAGGAVGDLDDHRRAAVAVVVGDAEELLVEQVAPADHATDEQQHRERRRGQPQAAPLGPLPQLGPARRQLLPPRREDLRAARHGHPAQRPNGWWSTVTDFVSRTSERNRLHGRLATHPGNRGPDFHGPGGPPMDG